jgi:hypothetical protein
MPKYDLVTLSDVLAGGIGVGFASQVNGSSKPYMQGVQSFVISVIARLASKPEYSFLGNLDDGQKNQLLIAVMSGIAGYSRGSGVLKAMLSGSSIDLLATEILHMIHQDDTGFLDLGEMMGGGEDIPRNNGRRHSNSNVG